MNDLLKTEFSVQVCNLLDQSLLKIQHCLSQIEETQVWWRPEPELNSIGNLLLHISGNLRQWAVSPLSNVSDDRDRESEFLNNVSQTKQELLELVQQTVRDASRLIQAIPASGYLERVTIQGFDVTVLKAILHTCSHFQGHTHQIIQLTRMIKKSDYQFHWSPELGKKNLPM